MPADGERTVRLLSAEKAENDPADAGVSYADSVRVGVGGEPACGPLDVLCAVARGDDRGAEHHSAIPPQYKKRSFLQYKLLLKNTAAFLFVAKN